MPVYEYQCENCNSITEELRSFKDCDNNVRCKCGGTAKHVLSNCTFALKGNGWYATDYKDKARNGGNAANRTASQNN
jgi:putative regulatory protein, FmdB family